MQRMRPRKLNQRRDGTAFVYAMLGRQLCGQGRLLFRDRMLGEDVVRGSWGLILLSEQEG